MTISTSCEIRAPRTAHVRPDLERVGLKKDAVDQLLIGAVLGTQTSSLFLDEAADLSRVGNSLPSRQVLVLT